MIRKIVFKEEENDIIEAKALDFPYKLSYAIAEGCHHRYVVYPAFAYFGDYTDSDLELIEYNILTFALKQRVLISEAPPEENPIISESYRSCFEAIKALKDHKLAKEFYYCTSIKDAMELLLKE